LSIDAFCHLEMETCSFGSSKDPINMACPAAGTACIHTRAKETATSRIRKYSESQRKFSLQARVMCKNGISVMQMKRFGKTAYWIMGVDGKTSGASAKKG